MAVSTSRPDPASPAAVASASFALVRKGFDPDEVRVFLREVAEEMRHLERQIADLRNELTSRPSGSRAPDVLDEEALTTLLGEETARIVQAAREAATMIRGRAEESAAKMLRDASDEASRIRTEVGMEAARRRSEAASEADATVEAARQQGRDMVTEAREYRERVLADVARRREQARVQLERLIEGRDRLLSAFERARLASVDVIDEFGHLGADPADDVDLAPTTGPVAVVAAPSEAVEDEQVSSAPVADRGGLTLVPAIAEVYDGEADDADEANEVPVGSTAAEDDSSAIASQDSVGEDDAGSPETDGPDLTDEADDLDDDHVDTADDLDTADDTAIDTADDTADDTGDDADDDTPRAPVVALFGGDADRDRTDHGAVPDAPRPAPRPSVDDLFARLRRASAEQVARDATAALAADGGTAGTPDVDEAPDEPAPVEAAPTGAGSAGDTVVETIEEPVEESVVEADAVSTIFTERDEILVPLIVSASRRLKRVLADEQNDVLDLLRRSSKARSIEALLPSDAEQAARYAAAVDDDVRSAAAAGARSFGGDGSSVGDVLGAVTEALSVDVLRPLRERLERAVTQVGEDPDELASLVRSVYREWKTQRIDEHVEDLVRLAHGRGAFAVIAPGTPVCWRVDPDGPPCADAEDNALAGIVEAGDPFPTGHTNPPMHAGCRCMLEMKPG